MMQNIEGVHVGFLRQVVGKKAQRLGGGIFWKDGSNRVLQAKGTKPLRYNTNNSQATVAEWGGIRPIFEVCAKDTEYEGGGRL